MILLDTQTRQMARLDVFFGKADSAFREKESFTWIWHNPDEDWLLPCRFLKIVQKPGTVTVRKLINGKWAVQEYRLLSPFYLYKALAKAEWRDR